MNWVTIKKLADLTGYTVNAIRAKVKRGDWRINEHYIKSPDGRLQFKTDAIEQWIEQGA